MMTEMDLLCVGCGKVLARKNHDPEQCTEDGEPLCYDCALQDEAGVLNEPN
jgi:hypothetical protein